MFKVGDTVKLIKSYSIPYKLKQNKSYIVEKLSLGFIQILNENNELYYYSENYFVLNIKQIRKQKLKNICSKSEIE